MLLDHQLVLSDDQALTATANSTNVIDTTTTTSKLGAGKAEGVGVFIAVAADHTTGDETYQFQLVSSAAANLGTPTVHSDKTILYSALTAGAKFFFPIGPNDDVLQFLGMIYTLAGNTPTVTVKAAQMTQEEFEVWKAYPIGYNIQ
jgi:hypothetical protein